MKTWLRRDEWTQYAACVDSEIHTSENPSEDDMEIATWTCFHCTVRVECIEWALREKACAVVVAGVYLPDPKLKKELKEVYGELERSLPGERERRGEDV